MKTGLLIKICVIIIWSSVLWGCQPDIYIQSIQETNSVDMEVVQNSSRYKLIASLNFEDLDRMNLDYEVGFLIFPASVRKDIAVFNEQYFYPADEINKEYGTTIMGEYKRPEFSYTFEPVKMQKYKCYAYIEFINGDLWISDDTHAEEFGTDINGEDGVQIKLADSLESFFILTVEESVIGKKIIEKGVCWNYSINSIPQLDEGSFYTENVVTRSGQEGFIPSFQNWNSDANVRAFIICDDGQIIYSEKVVSYNPAKIIFDVYTNKDIERVIQLFSYNSNAFKGTIRLHCDIMPEYIRLSGRFCVMQGGTIEGNNYKWGLPFGQIHGGIIRNVQLVRPLCMNDCSGTIQDCVIPNDYDNFWGDNVIEIMYHGAISNVINNSSASMVRSNSGTIEHCIQASKGFLVYDNKKEGVISSCQVIYETESSVVQEKGWICHTNAGSVIDCTPNSVLNNLGVIE